MIFAFVILVTVVSMLIQHRLAARAEARILARIDQAIAGVRVTGHPAAQRQVKRQELDIARPLRIQVD